MKKLWKSVKIWQSYGREFSGLLFFGPPCTTTQAADTAKHAATLSNEIRLKTETEALCFQLNGHVLAYMWLLLV